MERGAVQRRAAGLAPFDGQSVHPVAMLPVARLSQRLVRIVGELEERFVEVELECFYDRHEVDGAVSTIQPTTFAQCNDLISDPERLFGARSSELLVSLAWHSPGRFLLRTYVAEENEDAPGRLGDYDVTAAPQVVESLARLLRACGDEIFVDPALEYFRRRAAEPLG